MERHIRLLAILHIANAALIILVEPFILYTMRQLGLLLGVFGRSHGYISGHIKCIHILGLDIPGFFAPLWILLVMAPLFVGLPGLVGGLGLLYNKNWARIVVMIVGILCLPNFPLGTALGIYTFWVLLRPQAAQQTAS
jgi:hypothetical protein